MYSDQAAQTELLSLAPTVLTFGDKRFSPDSNSNLQCT